MNNYLMKFNEIQAGIAYKHSWLKRELDGLNPGDTIYCNINMPDRDTVRLLKEWYPKGTRVELVSMHDPYRHMEAGLKGTVMYVDDIGTIHVQWDDGGILGVVHGEDHIRKI